MTTTQRHSWGSAIRPSNQLSIRQCTKCRVKKFGHHDTDQQTGLPYHWTEYMTHDDRQIGCVGTPPCEGAPRPPPVIFLG